MTLLRNYNIMKNEKLLTAIVLAIIAVIMAACSGSTKSIPLDEDVAIAIYPVKPDNGTYTAAGEPLLEEQIHLSEAFIYPQDDGMVTIPFNFQNVDRYAEITESNIGRHIAISINGTVVSAPLVKMRLENGACSAIMTKAQAKEIFPDIDL